MIREIGECLAVRHSPSARYLGVGTFLRLSWRLDEIIVGANQPRTPADISQRQGTSLVGPLLIHNCIDEMRMDVNGGAETPAILPISGAHGVQRYRPKEAWTAFSPNLQCYRSRTDTAAVTAVPSRPLESGPSLRRNVTKLFETESCILEQRIQEIPSLTHEETTGACRPVRLIDRDAQAGPLSRSSSRIPNAGLGVPRATQSEPQNLINGDAGKTLRRQTQGVVDQSDRSPVVARSAVLACPKCCDATVSGLVCRA